jgi:hypothetical protein
MGWSRFGAANGKPPAQSSRVHQRECPSLGSTLRKCAALLTGRRPADHAEQCLAERQPQRAAGHRAESAGGRKVWSDTTRSPQGHAPVVNGPRGRSRPEHYHAQPEVGRLTSAADVGLLLRTAKNSGPTACRARGPWQGSDKGEPRSRHETLEEHARSCNCVPGSRLRAASPCDVACEQARAGAEVALRGRAIARL